MAKKEAPKPEPKPTVPEPVAAAPEALRPNRIEGVCDVGTEQGVRFHVDSAGRRVVSEGHPLAGLVIS